LRAENEKDTRAKTIALTDGGVEHDEQKSLNGLFLKLLM
jgi:hypothetical protein